MKFNGLNLIVAVAGKMNQQEEPLLLTARTPDGSEFYISGVYISEIKSTDKFSKLIIQLSPLTLEQAMEKKEATITDHDDQQPA